VTSDPSKLTVVGATDLERRLLQAAGSEQPPPELERRMRLALGLAPFAAPTPAAPPTASSAAAPASAAAPVAAAKAGAAGWVAAGLVAAAVAGGVVMSRLQPAPAAPVASVAAPAFVEPAPAADEPAAAPVVVRRVAHAARVQRHAAAPAPAADLRAEIALVDTARTAVKSGDPERALALLHRYDAIYPAGAFRPEVAALRIEALAADGQTDLARARARDFIAAHPDSPLSARLARIAGAR
jgi:hypothetical protein